MVSWRRLTEVTGIAAGAIAAGAGALMVAEKIAVGRIRLRPDPAAGEPFGDIRGEAMTVTADDGLPLHVEISGPPDAPVTIIFCHGYTLNSDVWYYQRVGFADSARCVFWDQRSHGRSGRSDPDLVSIDQLGADLHEVIMATAPGDMPVVLVGHSMGGMTVMALADQHPELFGSAGQGGTTPPAPRGAGDGGTTPQAPRGAGDGGTTPQAPRGAGDGGTTPQAPRGKVIGAVLISSAASTVDPATWLPKPLRPAVRIAMPSLMTGASKGRVAELVERSRQSAGDLAFLGTRHIGFGDPRVSPTVVDFLERIIRATPIDVIADFYVALVGHEKRHALQVLGNVPVLIMTGDRDRLVDPRLSDEIASAIRDSKLIKIRGAGHVVILERPEEVNEAIAGLVTQALATRAAGG
jgi:pimeloyl-ACP methyl ester carboxylesterase